ncbi:bifunctional (p)ppGpp synthetase/guanosine-3',5'-bis(diphosphate) 3'-pyrophosphohydrolase [Desulfobotulus sp. H1]|uniref:Bifunctional (P)ppGpp synthetase/guanosine-3',5'-bis(Diphosphate) 3'-pyrophosphohydrolase n=1 Tax=Desulfobotulus pelophilus TaxID=2823377 RepID=A0ABT3N6Z6_9BACT|nr:bifunctional (p)ppGpp synthetase/guanosine-3',5'-bis(diphosphate) 3'-pyrophosphohydrolase [Desulfobotulus pelophilus]MCW7753231.1 bifunctional (p)ppGpp synthetase/guanosine-3',5'-bis(diphosphate) 3'-pyrophosphohydrolase [Desulfobotulus pelophilus]
MIRINDIIDRILEYDPEADIDLVERAYIYSARVHDGQVRLSGEPYLTHPLEVTGILADLRLDTISVAAGLLHDVVEDTHATEEEIRQMFGAEVGHIVAGVTKISKLPFQTSEHRQAESIRKMILAMADDIRVILIKLADRLHNMRTLYFHKKKEKVMKISQETWDIYSPIAARLGMYQLKNELDDLAFRHLKPEAYAEIEAGIAKDREERENYVREVQSLIQTRMDESGLPADVTGRYKQIPSIYQKMVQQKLSLSEIYDLTAFRIILKTVPQCYEALGVIHSLWRPLPKKFKDYIGMPKPNMYQSLHTTVIGPYGERIEVQIRTWDMDRVAKSGIAAHWSYKEGKSADPNIARAFAWIQNLVENQEDYRDPHEFMENVRIDLFPDEVYVFTPRGEVKNLPKGATPVDFAYMIHTEVGEQCAGAKINGRMVPLSHEMRNGDIVEIITAKDHTPSKDWLNFVKTVRAKNRIRLWVKSQEKERSLSLGRELCEKTFRKRKLNFSSLVNTDAMLEVAQFFNFKTVEDLLANVGYGKVTPLQVLRRYAPSTEPESKGPSFIQKLISGRNRRKPRGEGVVVKGLDDILIRFGKCCQPVPGDAIIGYITQGQGVSVHHKNCPSVNRLNPDRYVDVDWAGDNSEYYPVKIQIHSHDRLGLLADMASAITRTGANILNAHTETGEDMEVSTFFTVGVTGRELLDKVLSALRQTRDVVDVRRLDM